eukprot:2569137-Alexandrium_andersonii.AAC.1
MRVLQPAPSLDDWLKGLQRGQCVDLTRDIPTNDQLEVADVIPEVRSAEVDASEPMAVAVPLPPVVPKRRLTVKTPSVEVERRGSLAEPVAGEKPPATPCEAEE